MLEKINSKKNFQFSIFNFQSIFKFLILNFKFLIFIALFLLLFYTRFINIGWGLPYPMHPDERNMASAVQQLNCKFSSAGWRINLRECFNPHFFAYGQFPLYLGYLIVYFLKFFDGDIGLPISFQEAVISLRIISAIASIINAFILLKIIKSIIFNKFSSSSRRIIFQLFILLILIFSPYAIQFSHFGTTESLLMLFYSLIIYLLMQMFERRTTDAVVWLGLVSGLAVATKVSSIIFIIVPLITILSSLRSWNRYKNIIKFGMLTIIFMVLFSPHNLINFKDFISSINYESEVALGKSLVFYTRQFFNTVPIVFQITKVFPYVLGWPVFILGALGFLGLGWNDKKINLLRFAFLIYFIPSALIYAKWSRFMTPVLPLMLILSILFLFKLKNLLFDNSWINSKFRIQNSKVKVKSQKFLTFYFLISFLTFTFLLLTCIIPGIAYLHIYQNYDVRFQASDWIYNNVKNNNYLLFETANVVDIPIPNPKLKTKNQKEVEKIFQSVSFNFYDLDISQELQSQLKAHIEKADYIFIPSRRIVANNTCQGNFQFSIFNFQSNTKFKCLIFKQKYPILNQYYEDLFSGKLGFEKVAEFNSFPKICLPLMKKCLEFPDEEAEETWTVFDHPVIRIYKNIKS